MDIFSLHLNNHPPPTTINNDRSLIVVEIELDSTSTTGADRITTITTRVPVKS